METTFEILDKWLSTTGWKLTIFFSAGYYHVWALQPDEATHLIAHQSYAKSLQAALAILARKLGAEVQL